MPIPLATGDGAVVATEDGGATWSVAIGIPGLAASIFGPAKIADLAATSRGRLVATGIWNHAYSDDGGRRWGAASLTYASTLSQVQVAAVSVRTASVAVAAGYYYLGRSDDAGTLDAVTPPRDAGWLSDVTWSGGLAWWGAGDHGALFASTDDGRTWGDRSPPGETRNFYALDFYDTSSGVAVRMNGTA